MIEHMALVDTCIPIHRILFLGFILPISIMHRQHLLKMLQILVGTSVHPLLLQHKQLRQLIPMHNLLLVGITMPRTTRSILMHNLHTRNQVIPLTHRLRSSRGINNNTTTHPSQYRNQHTHLLTQEVLTLQLHSKGFCPKPGISYHQSEFLSNTTIQRQENHHLKVLHSPKPNHAF